MSAPHTDIEKQERRHKPVLVVLRVIIVGAVLALIGFAALQILGSDESPDGGLSETTDTVTD